VTQTSSALLLSRIVGAGPVTGRHGFKNANKLLHATCEDARA
jgi:hypothetical protein